MSTCPRVRLDCNAPFCAAWSPRPPFPPSARPARHLQAVPYLKSSSARLGIATRSVPDLQTGVPSAEAQGRPAGVRPSCPALACGPHAWDHRQRPGPLQTYTAVYYVLADALMLSLYLYYKFKKRPSPCEYGGPGRQGPGGAGGWEEAVSCGWCHTEPQKGFLWPYLTAAA